MKIACIAFSFWIAAVAYGSQVIFFEEGFPAADSVSPPRSVLQRAFPDSIFAAAGELGGLLSKPETRLLILPFGSAFPEGNWKDIETYLGRGGNLLIIGGAPFTRAASKRDGQWTLRDPSIRFARCLFINEYQSTPGSAGLEFETNPDFPLRLPRFGWQKAFSPIIRLSYADLYPREGSAGSIDARLDALVWGSARGRRLAAPLLQIDHLKNQFVGGRWIFLAALPDANFFPAELLNRLARIAGEGSEEFAVRPASPLLLPGEPLRLQVEWSRAKPLVPEPTIGITITPEAGRIVRKDFALAQTIDLPPMTTQGFHVIEASLHQGRRVRRIYRSAFWMRDESYLRSGPRLSVNADFFELDGQPLPVIGTTTMASDAQRQFFLEPNTYVWDRDLAGIHEAGLNMIRTGWWSGWDLLVNDRDEATEETLRTLEAFLMTARRHSLPVQLTFFSFIPDPFGGGNSYLSAEAVRRQHAFLLSIVRRFKDVPYLAYLINEPSFQKPLWQTRPNGDETGEWNAWLGHVYPDRQTLLEAWSLATAPEKLPLPSQEQFALRSVYRGLNSLAVYDFYRFAQESFAEWVDEGRKAIRGAGSHQLLTVGQDDGGYINRMTPAFFGGAIDFTTNHTWWLNDALLWNSLVAKQSDKPMLIQETGVQRELVMDERSRRTPENEASLLERKLAMSLAGGAGAIQWLWNTNTYMTSDNEVAIGALRADGTEKPEVAILRGVGEFLSQSRDAFVRPVRPEVAIVTSQALQYSVLNSTAIEAQEASVRALHYYARIPGYLVAENQIAALGAPRLVILPSAQALSDTTWGALLAYVGNGGTLLITGPVERDAHWHPAKRITALLPSASVEPLTFRHALVRLGSGELNLSFAPDKQESLEVLRLDGLTETRYGKGTIMIFPYPVELADTIAAAGAVYGYVVERAGLHPAFTLDEPLSPGVLVYVQPMEQHLLYVLASDTGDDVNVALRDLATGARLALRLKSQRAALAVVRRSDRRIVARYGF